MGEDRGKALKTVEFIDVSLSLVLWGYIHKTGKLVIKPHFVDVANFQNGLAWVVRK
ncbi:WG repeat-containing protein [Microcoleus sp. FACHB-53]|nr:WG repeat-containing protein [Microcoleus sp. FACHB-53]